MMTVLAVCEKEEFSSSKDNNRGNKSTDPEKELLGAHTGVTYDFVSPCLLGECSRGRRDQHGGAEEGGHCLLRCGRGGSGEGVWVSVSGR
jgi:hypothetical protein